MILSFENHCNRSNQEKMAKYCLKSFGKLLMKDCLKGFPVNISTSSCVPFAIS